MDKWLSNTTVVRIFALVLGIMLWAVVHFNSQTTSETTSAVITTDEISNVTITIVGLDENKFYLKMIEPQTVTLRLKGRETALKRVDPNKYQVQVDLSKAIGGSHNFNLRSVGFPSGVNVEMYPSSVQVELEELQKKEVEVSIALKGTPAAGFKAGEPIVQPNKVHVTVPSSMIDQIGSVSAEVSLQGAKEAVKKQVKLIVYDTAGKQMEGVVTPAVVDVEVPVTSPFKVVPLQIQLKGQPPDGYSVASYKQSVAQVTVFAPQDVLDKLDFYSAMQIDLSQLKNDKSFSLDIPLKDNVLQVEPKKVDIDMRVVASATKTIELPITISGVNEGHAAQVVTPDTGRISFVAEGAPELLDAMKSEDAAAIVDVTNLTLGKHDLPLKINLPSFIKLAPNQVLTITVDITQKSVPATGTNTGQESTSGSSEGASSGTGGGSGTGSADTPGAGEGKDPPKEEQGKTDPPQNSSGSGGT